MAAAFDQELTDRANAILRRGDPRLAAASPLLGKIAVLFNPTNPPRPPAEPKPRKGRKAPPDVAGARSPGALAAEAAASGEVSAPPPGPPRIPAPWHKLAVAARCSEPSLNGEKYLAKITVDGGVWGQLGEVARDLGLWLALRSLRAKEGEGGAEGAEIEKPPIRVWPDAVDEAGELMAAATEDPKLAAELAGALRPGGPLEALEEAVDAIERLLDAGNDGAPRPAYLRGVALRLQHLADAFDDPEATDPEATEGLEAEGEE